jgi:tRNA dimethylallyltransferase
LAAGYTLEHTAMNGIGYKEIIGYLQGEYDLEKAEELLRRNTHRYAKRQRSWFRRYRAEGKQMPKDDVTYILIELQ